MLALVIRWWLMLVLIGLVALPLTSWLFQRLPGRGIAWSKPLGLLVTGYSAWLLTMLGFTRFSLGAMIISLLMVGALGWFVWRGQWQRATLRHVVQRYWLPWAGYELLFGMLFGIGIWLRLNGGYGSAIQHTEKPMELMLLNSVLTSPIFPPADLWLAGYSINYYYLGYVLVGVIAVLSSVPLGVAFNLGVASILALAGIGIAGLVATLVGLAQTPREARINWGQVSTALLAVMLVFFTGNQLGALNRLAGTAQLNRLNDIQKLRVLGQGLADQPLQVDTAEVAPPLESATLAPMTDFNWWIPSRVIYDGQSELITEFPYFSFYLGDMHPHVLSLPWTILALALVLSLLVHSRVPDWLGSWPGRIELGLTGLIIGVLYAINSWDAPTYGLIFAGGLLLLYQHLQPQQWQVWWKAYGKQLGLVVVTALILFAPFLLTFTSFAGQESVPAAADVPIIRTIGRIIGPALNHTSLGEFVIIFGLFLAPLGAWWASQMSQWRVQSGVVGGMLVFGLLLGVPLLALGPLAFFLFRGAWRNADQPVRSFGLLVCGVGALLVFSTDIFYLRDHFDNRMNTIFKFFYQTWIMWGSIAAWSVWWLLGEGRWRSRLQLAWLPLWLLFFAGALVYPVSTVTSNQGLNWTPEPTLDGLEYSSYTVKPARMLAEWLKHNAPEDAVLVSHIGASYQGGGEVATLSGRATLLAWPGSHQGFWRSKQPLAREEVGTRPQAVQRIYTSTDPNEVGQLLKKYSVDYIIWSPAEQQAYAGATTQVINQLATIVHEADGWVLYHVNSSLPADEPQLDEQSKPLS